MTPSIRPMQLSSNCALRWIPAGQALEQAKQLDAEGKSKPHKDILYGIPFVAKDNYNTAGIPTSGGSAALKHSIPSANAFVVQKLLEQGAILVGKSNMSELA